MQKDLGSCDCRCHSKPKECCKDARNSALEEAAKLIENETGYTLRTHADMGAAIRKLKS